MKSKNIILFFLFSLFLGNSVFAQDNKNQKKFDIESFKKKRTEFIIEKVNLTDKEAKEFIPLSEEFMDKRFEMNRSIRREMRDLRRKQKKTDADYERLIDADIAIKIKEAQLEQEYMKRFKKVLSAEKIFRYKQADNEFMKNTVEQRKSRRNNNRK